MAECLSGTDKMARNFSPRRSLVAYDRKKHWTPENVAPLLEKFHN